MIELLAPAGNEECFYAAVNNGANAVYLGLKDFSARKNADNFSFEKLKYLCSYAKLFGVSVYVTVNTLIKDSELDNFLTAIENSLNCGADAFILQDIFLGKTLKNLYPEIKLHLSTQAGVCNIYGARLAKEYGFERVILARETSFTDIEEISKIIQTEVFIQGALCSSFSGHCYLSSFIGGKSGNRGLCKQPCRKKYTYYVSSKPYADGYALSLCDLSVGENIKKLIDAGVTSFKIEGRMRRPEYVAAACNYYGKIIKGDKGDISPLKRTFNRGNYTLGLAFNDYKHIISPYIQNHMGEFKGKVSSVNKNTLTLNNKVNLHSNDCFKILRNNTEVGNGKVLEENGRSVLKFNGEAKAGDDIYLTTDTELNKNLLSKKLKKEIKISGKFLKNEKAELTAYTDGHVFGVTGDICEKAKNSSLTFKDFKDCMEKIDNYPYEIDIEKLKTDGIFMPKSKLNELRRELYFKIFNSFNNNIKPYINHKEIEYNYVTHNKSFSSRTAIISSDFSFENKIELTEAIFAPNDYNDEKEFKKFFSDIKKFKEVNTFLYLPPFADSQDINIISKKLGGFDGVYCDGYYGLKLAEKENKLIFVGAGLNIFNSVNLQYLKNSTFTVISKELSYEEMKSNNLLTENSFIFNLGKIKVMDLIYCPFSKNCENCKVKPDNITLKDDEGRTFAVRKYKLSTCRFEIFNTADLLYKIGENVNKIYNFTTYTADKINNILDNINNENNLKIQLHKVTNGNLKRGIE